MPKTNNVKMQTANTQPGPDISLASEPADVWDMSQERVFIENLLCQRFNFLLIFYSLVVAGAFATNSQINFTIALALGAFICTLLSFPIARSQHKLDLLLKHIWATQTEHPSKKANDWSYDLSGVPRLMRWSVRGSRRGIVGYWAPLLCSVSLWIGALLACFGMLKAN